MKRLTAAAAAAALLLAACGEAALGPPDIRGTITQKTSNPTFLPSGDDPLGTILIEGTIEPDTQFDRASVKVTGDTDIFRAVDGKMEDASFHELQVGQRVEAWFRGPVAESYPVQATAGRIVVLE